jgi:hypothetical protein
MQKERKKSRAKYASTHIPSRHLVFGSGHRAGLLNKHIFVSTVELSVLRFTFLKNSNSFMTIKTSVVAMSRFAYTLLLMSIIGLAQGQFITSIGGRGLANQDFAIATNIGPGGITFDSNDNAYITDTYHHVIWHYFSVKPI